MANQFLNKKGQATLETALMFAMVVMLVGGMLNIWFWMNNQIVQRQKTYNDSRVASGKAEGENKLQWPLDYQPEELKEEEVILAK